MRVGKKAEVSAACEQIIYAGINVTLSDGTTEHYSLTEHDQLNLFGKLSQISVGAAQLEYHADGQSCRYYTAIDMQAIIQAAMWHVSYHTTYCNALNMWIAGCQSTEEVQEIFYGADVPKQYRSEVLNAYLVQIAQRLEWVNMGHRLLNKYLTLFDVGGLLYILLELAWRGWSHWTMFVLGGCVLLALGLSMRSCPGKCLCGGRF